MPQDRSDRVETPQSHEKELYMEMKISLDEAQARAKAFMHKGYH